MRKENPVLLYDVTVQLESNWTVLLVREAAKELLKKVKELIRPETKIILLDFINVSAMDKSFFNEFLTCLYEIVGDIPVVGINLKAKVIEEDIPKTGANTALKRWGYVFPVVGQDGTIHLLGAEQQLYADALKTLWSTPEGQTREQLAYRLDVNKRAIRRAMNYLMDLGFATKGKTSRQKLEYYKPRYVDLVRPSIGKTIEDRVREAIHTEKVLEQGHFKLPSGAHIMKFYHLSKVFRNARLVCGIGNHFATKFGGLEPTFVLTLETPNNIILAHRIAQYTGERNTRSIFANFHPIQERMVLHRGFSIGGGERGLIAVDTISTGFFVDFLINLINDEKGDLVGICSVLDLSKGRRLFPSQVYRSLVQEDAGLHKASECKSGIPIVSPRILPGDRKW